MLKGTTIDNIVFGGPAWKVGNELQPSDIILQVPETATDNQSLVLA